MASVAFATTRTISQPPRRMVRTEILQLSFVPAPMTWRLLDEKLDEFRQYAPDWDGQGAESPPSQTVTTAKALSIKLQVEGWPCPHTVRVTPDGCIAFHWTDELERPLELEVSGQSVETISLSS